MSKITGKVKDICWVISWQYDCLNHDCPICRSGIETSKENDLSIGSCGHGFHSKCIDDWFKQYNLGQKKCPVCSNKWVNKLPAPVKQYNFKKVINNYDPAW